MFVLYDYKTKTILRQGVLVMYLISQFISLIGMAFGLVAFQCKKHSGIMAFKLTHELLSAIHYVILGEYTGAVMNLLGCVRNGLFSVLVSKGKKTTGYVVLFSFLFIGFGALVWEGPKSLLIMGAKVLSCIAYGCKDTAVVRKLALLTNTGWFIYNLIVFSIAGFVCDGLLIVSVIIGIVRHDLLPYLQRKRAEKEEKVL